MIIKIYNEIKLIEIIIIILLIITFNSCFTSKFGNNFIYKLDGKPNGIDSICNVDGLFFIKNKGDHPRNYFMFYRDGTFADVIFVHKTQNQFTPYYVIDKVFAWGGYYIYGDTIKAQSISDNGYIMDMNERWFKIVDYNTLIEIYRKCIVNCNQEDKIQILNDTANFISLKNRPDSTCWLKEKIWAWKKNTTNK